MRPILKYPGLLAQQLVQMSRPIVGDPIEQGVVMSPFDDRDRVYLDIGKFFDGFENGVFAAAELIVTQQALLRQQKSTSLI